jgi:hypothetical protein
MSKTLEIRVIATTGRHIVGYGSRRRGEIITLPEELANDLLRNQPDAFEAVKKSRAAEEVDNGD